MRGAYWIVLGFDVRGCCTSIGDIMLLEGGWAFAISVQRLHRVLYMSNFFGGHKYLLYYM